MLLLRLHAERLLAEAAETEGGGEAPEARRERLFEQARYALAWLNQLYVRTVVYSSSYSCSEGLSVAVPASLTLPPSWEKEFQGLSFTAGPDGPRSPDAAA